MPSPSAPAATVHPAQPPPGAADLPGAHIAGSSGAEASFDPTRPDTKPGPTRQMAGATSNAALIHEERVGSSLCGGLLAALARHPDATRRAGDRDPARLNGLQQVQLLPNGVVIVVWHWGARRFEAGTALADLANYLREAQP